MLGKYQIDSRCGPAVRQGPYGMATYAYVALLVAAGPGWPDRNEVLAIGRLE